MADKNYDIPATPDYSEDIRELQDTDAARASALFNPLFRRIITNIAYLFRSLSAFVPTSRKVNNKALTSDISLTASDVGADSSGAAAAVQTSLSSHTANSTIHVTSANKTAWNGKLDASKIVTTTIDPGAGSSSSYTTGTLLFVYE